MEAVDLISDGKAPKIPQPEEGATYDKIWKKKEVAKVCIIKMLLIIYFHEELFHAVSSSIYCCIFFATQINFAQPATVLHNFIRGNDKVSHLFLQLYIKYYIVCECYCIVS